MTDKAGDLARKVRSRSTLEKAWRAIEANARTSKSDDTKNEIKVFAAKSRENVERIYRLLLTQKFVFPPAKGVKIPKDKKDKSKFRPLVVAKVESRIVQRAIHDVLLTVPEIDKYIRTPHSFGGVKKLKNPNEDEVSAVPAAVKEVLVAIDNGAKFLAKSDIASFFTKIPKSAVTAIISSVIADTEFLELFSRAIAVELGNMAQLKESAAFFPTSDIGVAQGNSLSPLLGNIILYDFDQAMNKDKDIRCIRYIDDFIILGPNKNAVKNAYAKALHLLKKHGMGASPGKEKFAATSDVFNFLGIEFANGFIRPGVASQTRMLASIDATFAESIKAFRAYRKADTFDRSMSLLRTLKKARGIMHGWAKHYSFCNDGICLKQLDAKISQRLRKYLSIYGEERDALPEAKQWNILGVEAISSLEMKPLKWTTKKASAPILPIPAVASGTDLSQPPF